MAWVDVTNAHDMVDHEWLSEMISIHRFLRGLAKVVTKLSFLRPGIPRLLQELNWRWRCQRLRPHLLTLCLNPISCKLKATEGYRLSKPIGTKVTHFLYIDDLKIFAASAPNLNTVMELARSAMQDVGLDWNPKKCSVVHTKRGLKVEDAESLAFDDASVIKCPEVEAQYKFLGVLESTRQEDQIALNSPPRCI
ncbi:uncharacterized protein [Montipora capricornis]|uniref:uncharacterized protein n=1 Tax=Montipora capricornis TaxID=246305 RepID=UPI0035F15065